jgi:hypothetical protein
MTHNAVASGPHETGHGVSAKAAAASERVNTSGNSFIGFSTPAGAEDVKPDHRDQGKMHGRASASLSELTPTSRLT